MATSISRIRVRPARDEWGVYDPQQAGIAALMNRVDQKKEAKTAAANAAAPAPAATEATDAPRPRSLRDAQ